MLVRDFHFDLPEELIAQAPPATRGTSRMLVVDRASGRVRDDVFASLPEHLRAGDVLVLNDSRVIPARLYATRAGLRTQRGTGDPTGRIEVLLTSQIPGVQQTGSFEWSALVKPGRKVPVGETLLFADATGAEVLRAEVVAAGEFGERRLRFSITADASDQTFWARIERVGHMPLPPYIRRNDSLADRTRYQTVYAQAPGSSAAPTAGLHFTPEILEAVRARGVQVCPLTLHVGLGTFQPVRVERLDQIHLHSEHYTVPSVSADAINRALAEGRRIIAAGTTTTRALEHCAAVSPRPQELKAHSGSTDIFLHPGHHFRVVSGLLTNFHLPESTLLMLVSAFLAAPGEPDVGRQRALAAYTHAVRERYRFFSYGDAMLLL